MLAVLAVAALAVLCADGQRNRCAVVLACHCAHCVHSAREVRGQRRKALCGCPAATFFPSPHVQGLFGRFIACGHALFCAIGFCTKIAKWRVVGLFLAD